MSFRFFNEMKSRYLCISLQSHTKEGENQCLHDEETSGFRDVDLLHGELLLLLLRVNSDVRRKLLTIAYIVYETSYKQINDSVIST